MISRRPAAERGHADHGWLTTRHTFSFADYHDPVFMGFRSLRVINEDRVQPAMGLGAHAHRDIEILTWVLEGALQHHDSVGNGSTIYPGDLQRLSAGTGISHSEFNASRDDPVHFLQIWILPETQGLIPAYEQRRFTINERQGAMKLLASRDGRGHSVRIHQDVDLYTTMLTPGEKVTATLGDGRHGWLQVSRGVVTVNGLRLDEGDGAAITAETRLDFEAPDHTEVLLFDLA
jgi:redox-sensitive bicupin YhaK (pirin superfamily)